MKLQRLRPNVSFCMWPMYPYPRSPELTESVWVMYVKKLSRVSILIFIFWFSGIRSLPIVSFTSVQPPKVIKPAQARIVMATRPSL